MQNAQQNLTAPLPAGEIAQKIIKDCGLQDVLGQSVCLSCVNRVLVQDDKKRATLYCRALFRDVEVSIVACTDMALPSAT